MITDYRPLPPYMIKITNAYTFWQSWRHVLSSWVPRTCTPGTVEPERPTAPPVQHLLHAAAVSWFCPKGNIKRLSINSLTLFLWAFHTFEDLSKAEPPFRSLTWQTFWCPSVANIGLPDPPGERRDSISHQSYIITTLVHVTSNTFVCVLSPCNLIQNTQVQRPIKKIYIYITVL